MSYSMELLEDVYEKCLELDETEREAYVEQVCKNNEPLRAILTQMLLNGENSVLHFQELQQTIVAGILPDHRPTMNEGEMVGKYRILRLLGSGGMSNVYLAERSDGEFEQQIAIKCFLSSGVIDGDKLVKKGEQQILSKLEHPNIARIQDAGVTQKGVPYFMMEYIDGVPVDVFVQKSNFNLNRRLKIFQQIGESVAYAHSRLILHLDVKPSNILVNKEGQIRLLDFGISSTIETSEKHGNVFFGTPSIAAPEQLEGKPVTAATDVYQLGILLHQLIANKLPIGISGSEERELTRGELPTVVPEKIIADEINFELTAVIERCLARDPQDRYQSVALLLQDIQNYLSGYPITAVNRGSGYAAIKYVKRNKTVIISISLICISLIAGTGFSLLQAHKTKIQRDLAVSNEKVATANRDFLIDLFMEANPSIAKGDTMTVYQFLDKAFEKTDDYSGSAEIQLELLTTLGRSYRSMGDFRKSRMALEKAYAVAKDSSVQISPAYIRAVEQLGLYQRDVGHYDSARILLNEVLSMYKDINYPEVDSFYTASLKYLSYVYKTEQKLDTAKQLIEKTIRLEEQLWPSHNNINLAESYYILASIYNDQSNFEKAIEYQSKSLNLCESLMGLYFPGTLANTNMLASVLANAGKLEEALSYSIKAKNITLKLFGDVHHETATITDNLGVAYFKLAQYDSAYYYFKNALTIRNTLFGSDLNIRTHASYNNLLSLFATTGDQDSAKFYLVNALRVSASGKTNARQRSNTYKWAGFLYEQLKEYPLSKKYYQLSLTEYKSYLPNDNGQVIKAQKSLDKADSLMVRGMLLKKGGL
ncbi:MAG: serine/threonine-protein kinase [Cyclobacteriaceae bacterium]